ncbi:MAG: hypothetical protein HWD89_00435 [Tenacibaculum sp.]|uniref:hypothetical protein n=1 Tax=Tenacibaculum sp. TaxID=1906242 RepID=UPI0017F5A74D|nr:hypothetical protein [Tenacibaculum sp.]NVK07490.1 hypothetical protein [Tenacibaculum sp.]
MIRLSTFENRKFETIKNISQETFDKIQVDSEILKTAYTQFVIFKNVQINGTEYSEFLDKISDLHIGTVDIKIAHSQELLFQANRVILNLLSSFKFFIDNGEAHLKRKYGKDSEVAKEFRKLTSTEFDNVFAYRFLIKLRNYSLHLGFPLQGLELKAEKNIETPIKTTGSLQLSIDIDLIKKEKSLLGKIVYDDIKNLEEDIDLKPLIAELSSSILKIQKFIFTKQKEEIENAISNLETYAGKYKTKTNDIKVFNNLERNGNEVTFNAYHIPFEIITEFKKYIKNWC